MVSLRSSSAGDRTFAQINIACNLAFPNASVLTGKSEKTLRWIFSAQQKQHHQQSSASTDPDTEVLDVESILPTPETVDPRQQTLLRFFPLRTPSSSPFRPSREALAPRANETALRQEDFMRRRAFEQMQPPGSLSGSETTSLGYNQVDTDMSMDTDMELDTNQSSDASNLISKIGIMGCL